MLLNSCSQSEKDDSSRSDIDESAESKVVEVVATLDGNKAVAPINALSPHTLKISIPSDTRISFVEFLFLPRSFTESIDISIAEGSPVAHRTNLDLLGIANNFNMVNVSVPLVFTWTFDEDSLRPVTVRMKKPDFVKNMEDDFSNLGLIYRKNVADLETTKLGIVHSSEFSIEGDFISFETLSYGIYQLVEFSGSVVTSKTLESNEAINTATINGDEIPGSFAVSGPMQNLATTKYLPAHTLATWDPSNLASSYSAHFSKETDCNKASGKKYENLKSISLSVSELESGNYFVCVFANNKNGTVAAGNNGKVAISLDTTAPLKPVVAEISATGSNVDISWGIPAVFGPSGPGIYELQVGTTKNGSELFNGSVTTNEKQIIGEFGITVYVRYRVYDGAGNVSPWSESTSGLSL